VEFIVPYLTRKPDAQRQNKMLIADDHGILRHGLKRILEAEPDMIVVGEAATGTEAVGAPGN